MHRLDLATGGLLVVAKTRTAMQTLSAAFAAREVTKRYRAVLKGDLRGDPRSPSDAGHKHGRGRGQQRDEQQPPPAQRAGGDADHQPHLGTCAAAIGGQDAVTHWRVVTVGNGKTLVDYYPKTGRTHQLRKHSKHMMAPIMGDPRYRLPRDVADDAEAAAGLYLWACGVAFPPSAVPWRGDGVGLDVSIDPPPRFLDAVTELT